MAIILWTFSKAMMMQMCFLGLILASLGLTQAFLSGLTPSLVPSIPQSQYKSKYSPLSSPRLLATSQPNLPESSPCGSNGSSGEGSNDDVDIASPNHPSAAPLKSSTPTILSLQSSFYTLLQNDPTPSQIAPILSSPVFHHVPPSSSNVGPTTETKEAIEHFSSVDPGLRIDVTDVTILVEAEVRHGCEGNWRV